MAGRENTSELRGDGTIPLVAVDRLFRGLQDNNLGNGVKVPAGSSSVEILRTHGQDDLVEVVSLAISWALNEAENPDQPFAVESKLTLRWGVGGAKHQAVFDLLNGVEINVPCTSLELLASNPIVTILDGDNEPVQLPCPNIIVNASVGIGGLSKNPSNPARFTSTIGRLAQNDVVRIPIPDFAVSFNVTTTSAAAALGQIVAKQLRADANGANALAAHSSTTFDTGFGSVPIVNGARALELSNPGADNVDDVRVIFSICI